MSAVKLPVMFLVTLLICLPTLYFFNLLYGSQLTFAQTAALMMAAVTVTAALTLAFASIVLFFWLTVPDYEFFMLLNVGVLAITAWWGLAFLRQGMRYVQGVRRRRGASWPCLDRHLCFRRHADGLGAQAVLWLSRARRSRSSATCKAPFTPACSTTSSGDSWDFDMKSSRMRISDRRSLLSRSWRSSPLAAVGALRAWFHARASRAHLCGRAAPFRPRRSRSCSAPDCGRTARPHPRSTTVWRPPLISIKAGKVKKLLMTGDNRFVNYNEPEAMRKLAVQLGVPNEDIVLDYAGRRTYDSCYRAKEIFGVQQVIVVTQRFHLDRSLFLCDAMGVSSVGLVADRRIYPTYRWWELREVLATAAAWWDVNIGHPVPVLGEKLPIPVN